VALEVPGTISGSNQLLVLSLLFIGYWTSFLCLEAHRAPKLAKEARAPHLKIVFVVVVVVVGWTYISYSNIYFFVLLGIKNAKVKEL